VRLARHAALGALLLALPATAQEPAAAAAGVTIYRCSDSRGQLVALRDSPCRTGERQEVLQMQRPRDPPPHATAAPAPPPAPAPAAPAREVRIVTVEAPRPTYECTTPDGETYVSESGEGNPRWVPLWTVGYPVWPGGRPPVGRPPGPGPGPGVGPRPPHGVVVPAGGTWVRDACVRLAREEVCSRLSDRRYEILRRYHDTTPSERNALDREQRDIDQRLRSECPGY